MRSDEQFTADVLARVHSETARNGRTKRNAARIIAATIALLAAVGVFARVKTPKPQETIPANETANSGQHLTEAGADGRAADRPFALSLIVARAADAPEAETKTFAAGVDHTLPVLGYLRVDSIAGLDDRGIEALHKSYMAAIKERGIADWSYGYKQTQTLGFHFVQEGQFIIRAADPDALDRITVRCGEEGSVNPWVGYFGVGRMKPRGGASFTVTGEEYRAYCTGMAGTTAETRNGLLFDWFLSDDAMRAFETEPARTPAAVRDVVTVTAAFTDGSSQSFSIDIGFTEDGALAASISA